MTWLAVERTLSMAELGDLECSPVVGRQGGDQTPDYAGLANAAGVTADHNYRHYSLLPNRANAARLFRYSRSGLAGVPQNAMPLPRRIFFGKTPLCPPSMTPSWMRACSPTPTCPPMITLSSTVMLPENPACAAMITFSPIWQLWPLWTRLSILVPRPMRVVSRAPRSMVVFAPI